MATKTQNSTIETTTATVLGLVTKANKFALKTTERVALKSIDLTEKGLGLSTKVVKKGLKVSAKGQDVVFNTLETAKGKAIETCSKFRK